jgi:hypothetical protein
VAIPAAADQNLPIKIKTRQAGISMEETKILDQNDFVTGVAIKNSKCLIPNSL